MKKVSNEPLVSVIIPVYNVEPYLKRCLDSVIKQTYKNLQIIVVDDGSTDNSGKICDEYAKKDGRIEVIHKKNGGISSARNKGIKSVHGDFIVFVDSDDYVDKNYVSILYGELTKEDADMAVVGHKIIYCDRQIVKRNDKNCSMLSREALNSLLYDKCIDVSCWGKIYKKSLFKGVVYPEGKIFEDSAVTYKLFMNSKRIAVSSETPYFYTKKRKTSITTTKFSRDKYDLIEATERMTKDILGTFPDLRQACERRLMWAYLSTACQLAESTRPESEDIKRLMNYIKKNRKKVLKDRNNSKRDRFALLSSYFGFWIFRIIWKTYSLVSRRVI